MNFKYPIFKHLKPYICQYKFQNYGDQIKIVYKSLKENCRFKEIGITCIKFSSLIKFKDLTEYFKILITCILLEVK